MLLDKFNLENLEHMSSIPSLALIKLLWNILLLRPDVEDFKTWLFCNSKGSPLTVIHQWPNI